MNKTHGGERTDVPGEGESNAPDTIHGEVVWKLDIQSTHTSIVEGDSAQNTDVMALWTAALCECLRRYGAPSATKVTVFVCDRQERFSRRPAIDLSFAENLNTKTLVPQVSRWITPGASDEEENSAEPVPLLVGWKIALILNSDSTLLPEAIVRRFDRIFAVKMSSESTKLVAARRGDLADIWPLKQMLNHWKYLGRQMCKNPGEEVRLLPVLTPSEMESMIVAYNQAEERNDDSRFGFELFDDQVKQTPDAPAVTDGNRTLTYRELWERTNQLARYLQQLGVGPETIVGVLLERSIDLVVAVIGLLKAGGAYLPIDPAYPGGRIEYLIQDSRLGFLITSDVAGVKHPPGNYRVVRLDQEDATIASMPTTSPKHGLKSTDMSYVFYTSGSTGLPKGVVMPHTRRAPIDRSRSQADNLAVGEKALLKSAVGFTLILREIFWPLHWGGHLVIVPPGLDRDSAYLARVIREEKVVGANFVPSMLDLLVNEPGFENCTSLRLIFTVGDSLTADLQQRIFARLPAVRLFVYYGCTEAPAATFRECRPDESCVSGVIIGRPMAKKKVYLLDSNLVPVPPGVAGEIHTGGAISRCYLHRPELTAARFIPNPFADRSGERMYRTGDMARWLPNGELEFLGRTDFQVQVGGVRIEMGEIEAVIRTFPGVKDVIVMEREFGSGDRRLVAYILGSEEIQSSGPLRTHLAEELPRYMIPTVLVRLETWPLLPSGKIDRNALLAVEIRERESATEHVAPRTETEQKLVQLWESILGRTHLGIRDNFFDCGGTSLLAMRLIQEINREFKHLLPLRAVSAEPTIERLATILEKGGYCDPATGAAVVHALGAGTPLFYVPGILGMAFMPEGMAAQVGADRTFFDRLRVRGLDGTEPPLDCVEAIAQDLISQIREIRSNGPYFLSGYSFGGLVAYEIACQMTDAGEIVDGVALLDPPLTRSWRRRPLPEIARRFVKKWSNLAWAERRDYVIRRVTGMSRRLRKKVGFQNPPAILKREDLSNESREIVKASFRAAAAYHPRPYSGRVLLLRARKDAHERAAFERAPLDGWGDLLKGPVEVTDLAYGHMDLWQEPAISEAGKRIAAFFRAHDGVALPRKR